MPHVSLFIKKASSNEDGIYLCARARALIPKMAQNVLRCRVVQTNLTRKFDEKFISNL